MGFVRTQGAVVGEGPGQEGMEGLKRIGRVGLGWARQTVATEQNSNLGCLLCFSWYMGL